MSYAQIEFLDVPENTEYMDMIDTVIDQCLGQEKLMNREIYISIVLTNHINIRYFNRKYRNIDKATDVLSFPMFEKEEVQEMIDNPNNLPKVLGDIIIALDIVKDQAEEYNHSFKRELSYMIVHGFYHLMGYDHMQESDKQDMRAKEEQILNSLNITRGDNL